MRKIPVKWKSVKSKDVSGSDILIELPELVDLSYRGTLISHILSMPQKTPIAFDQAINFLADQMMKCFDEGKIGDTPGEFFFYKSHFIDWISEMGFHIELSGDEFEAYALSDKVS